MRLRAQTMSRKGVNYPLMPVRPILEYNVDCREACSDKKDIVGFVQAFERIRSPWNVNVSTTMKKWQRPTNRVLARKIPQCKHYRSRYDCATVGQGDAGTFADFFEVYSFAR
jgi:hypothetical protein